LVILCEFRAKIALTGGGLWPNAGCAITIIAVYRWYMLLANMLFLPLYQKS